MRGEPNVCVGANRQNPLQKPVQPLAHFLAPNRRIDAPRLRVDDLPPRHRARDWRVVEGVTDGVVANGNRVAAPERAYMAADHAAGGKVIAHNWDFCLTHVGNRALDRFKLLLLAR